MGEKVVKVILFVSILCCVEILSKELYIIISNTQICKILDREFVQKVTCKSKNVNRTMNLTNREFIYQPGVRLTNYYMNMVVYRKFGLIYRQFMINIHVDLCELFAGNAYASGLAKVLHLQRRKNFGNMHNPCPISGRRYEFNSTFYYDSFPDIIPAGEYRVDVTYYTNVNGTKKNLMFMRSTGEVKTTTAEQWK